MWVSRESDVITVISYNPLGDCTVSHIPFYKGSVNGKSTVVYNEVPNPCYNEYICYISQLLCLRGQELQQMTDGFLHRLLIYPLLDQRHFRICNVLNPMLSSDRIVGSYNSD